MQLWFGFASVSFDDPMPLVVNVYFTAGHVIFAEAACLLSLITLVILDTMHHHHAPSSNPLYSLCEHPLVFSHLSILLHNLSQYGLCLIPLSITQPFL